MVDTPGNWAEFIRLASEHLELYLLLIRLTDLTDLDKKINDVPVYEVLEEIQWFIKSTKDVFKDNGVKLPVDFTILIKEYNEVATAINKHFHPNFSNN